MFSSFAVNKLLFAFKLSSCFQYLSILNSLLVTKLPSKPIASLLMKTLYVFSFITDNELDFPSNSLSSCEAVFNTSEVAFYYLETLKITGCTPFTNLTKSSFPTGYSITHLKLSYGGLEHVEANSLLVRT